MSTYPAPQRSGWRVTPVTVAILLLGAALVTWIVTVDRMHGMDAGPGTDLGGLAWFTGIWVTMMAAMMIPSAAPMVLLFHRVSTERAKRGQTAVPTWMFCLSYLAVWTLYGLTAYGLYRLIVHFDFGFLEWESGGRYVAGAAIAAAGRGAVVYLRQEGRGIGLLPKLTAYNLQDRGLDTVDANTAQGLPVDSREYSAAAQILRDLGVRSVALLSNNPAKRLDLEKHGVAVARRVPIDLPSNPENETYLRTKRDRMGHQLDSLTD